MASDNDSPTDESLLEEASRYSYSTGSFCALGEKGVGGLFFFFSFLWDGWGFGGGKRNYDVTVGLGGSSGELAVDPLSVILVDEMGKEKEGFGAFAKKALRKGTMEEERGVIEFWSNSCLAKFCHCLGMPTEGVEGEILKLLKRLIERRDHFEKVSGKKRKWQKSLRSNRELKKLECSVNYCGTGGGRQRGTGLS